LPLSRRVNGWLSSGFQRRNISPSSQLGSGPGCGFDNLEPRYCTRIWWVVAAKRKFHGGADSGRPPRVRWSLARHRLRCTRPPCEDLVGLKRIICEAHHYLADEEIRIIMNLDRDREGTTAEQHTRVDDGPL